jgi:uncharacterized membrane protein YbaN (DUF454 family)
MSGTTDALAPPLPPPLGRLAWALLGSVAAGLALLGFVLPGFPGLPFLVLAALCFANVSRLVHDRLASMPALRGALGQWRRARHRPLAVQLAVAGGLTLLALVETVRLGVQALRRR